ncbi:MAG: F0F1 ATP synthase subunit B [Chloroflexi bacterium]|nr:F0F1 ATP synthase subunit B [Chloroflexota bacterium]
MRRTFWKYVLLLVMAAALLIPTLAALAQEGEATAEPAAETQVEGEGAVGEEAAAEGEEAAAEEGGGIAALGLNAGYLIAQIINFGIIFGALTLLLWRPITTMLDARAAKIAKGLEDAQVAANARLNAEAEAERILASSRADISRAIEEGRARGEEVARQIEAEARTEAERIRNEARQAAEAERNQQLADLRGQVADIAVAISQRLIGASLDGNRQQALINDFFAKLPANARGLSGAVEVTSAMPLGPDEQARIQRELGAEAVMFKVDPSILGGLVVRAGDRVIDGSVRSGLDELAGRLG